VCWTWYAMFVQGLICSLFCILINAVMWTCYLVQYVLATVLCSNDVKKNVWKFSVMYVSQSMIDSLFSLTHCLQSAAIVLVIYLRTSLIHDKIELVSDYHILFKVTGKDSRCNIEFWGIVMHFKYVLMLSIQMCVLRSIVSVPETFPVFPTSLLLY